MVMEYLDGQPLTRVLSRLRGPNELSLSLKLGILCRVLAGLEHAHTLADLDGTPLGVVHRDVGPQNVFVTYSGQVKLVDFGVAKSVAASHHTRPGSIKGKLAYMAPEQLRGLTVDSRADLFSVGVMLWEILAGRRLWHGMTEVDIVGHLAAWRPLPPLPADGGVPHGLDAICARALELDPDRRYQTAADFEADLERTLIGAADSHARSLGRVVSAAFSAERADRRALVEAHLGLRHGLMTMTRTSVHGRALAPAAPGDGRDDTAATSGGEAGGMRAAGSGAPAPPVPKVALWLRRGAVGTALAGAMALMLLRGGVRHPLAAEQSAPAEPAHGAPAALAVPPPPSSPAAPALLSTADAAALLPSSKPDRGHKQRRRPLAPDADTPPATIVVHPPAVPVVEPLPAWPAGLPRPIITEDPFTAHITVDPFTTTR